MSTWSIFTDGGGDGAALSWALRLLQAIGAPTTQSNITFIYQWEKSEGGGSDYNPLNQGYVPGNSSLTVGGNNPGGGAANYVSWQAGLQGSVDYLHMPNYTKVLAALKAGDGNAAKVALWNSQWAASHYGYGKGWSPALPPSQEAPLTGDSGGNLAPYAPTTNPNAAIDPQELAQNFGFAYSMIQSIPELKNIFNQAVSAGWDASRFQAALMNTNWYRTHSAAQRAWITEGFTDPTTQSTQLNAQVASVQAAAAALGAVLSPGTAKSIATQFLQNGWNSDQLQQALSNYIKFDSSGALGGSSGTAEMTLRGLAQNNGVNVSNNWLLATAQHIANDSTSLQDAEGYIRKQAENLFPQYAKMIQGGQNMSDLAAPYAQDYQRILEVGPGSTNLFDSTMLKALQYKDPTGQNTTMPMWQFDQSLRNDPRWMKTQNAQDTTMGVAHGILQDFGFSI
jgi:hypothetical protein